MDGLLAAFTLFHVALSLIGIVSGFVVLGGMFKSKRLDGWTALFLITTTATSVTGYFFPFHGFKPSYAVGAIALIFLGLAIYARYSRKMNGSWRWIYVIAAMIGQYLNVFVLVVQLFEKIPALHALAPTQAEPPFAITQAAVMLAFVALTGMAARCFHPEHQPVSRSAQSVTA